MKDDIILSILNIVDFKTKNKDERKARSLYNDFRYIMEDRIFKFDKYTNWPLLKHIRVIHKLNRQI